MKTWHTQSTYQRLKIDLTNLRRHHWNLWLFKLEICLLKRRCQSFGTSPISLASAHPWKRRLTYPPTCESQGHNPWRLLNSSSTRELHHMAKLLQILNDYEGPTRSSFISENWIQSDFTQFSAIFFCLPLTCIHCFPTHWETEITNCSAE